MSKHKIEVVNVKEISERTHEYDIRIDDIPMKCKSVGVFRKDSNDMHFRLSLSHQGVKTHPDYREIRKQLQRTLSVVHGLNKS